MSISSSRRIVPLHPPESRPSSRRVACTSVCCWLSLTTPPRSTDLASCPAAPSPAASCRPSAGTSRAAAAFDPCLKRSRTSKRSQHHTTVISTSSGDTSQLSARVVLLSLPARARACVSSGGPIIGGGPIPNPGNIGGIGGPWLERLARFRLLLLVASRSRLRVRERRFRRDEAPLLPAPSSSLSRMTRPNSSNRGERERERERERDRERRWCVERRCEPRR